MLHSIALLAALVCAAQSATPASNPPAPRAALVIDGHGSPDAMLPRLDAKIVVDGNLDEPAWSEAARLTAFSQYQPIDNPTAREETEVLVWYSSDALYFGIIAKDREPSAVHATVADRDRLDQDDSVTIFLDTFNDQRRAFFFGVNPLGSQEDGVQTEGTSGGGANHGEGHRFNTTIDRSPDYQFDSKGRLTPEGYVVEIRIPFKSLRFPTGAEQRWGLNVVRKIQRTGYQDTWAEVRPTNPSFLAQAGKVRLHDVHPGVVTEVQPFVTTAVNGTLGENARFVRASPDTQLGVNGRVGFPGASIDATVNPDFSQVESDAGLVTVNERFALFYPEKRPFFLEGIELFATPNQLIYTRRIANPIAGGKATGKLGPIGFAYLTAGDDMGASNEFVNVARIRADLGKASTAGVAMTDRNANGYDNHVLAADARWVFGLYYLQGQLGQSSTRVQDTRKTAPLWLGEFDRTGRNFGFNYKVNAIGEGFNAASGYVPRQDIVEAHAFNRVSFFPSPGSLVESIRNQYNITRFWHYADFMHTSPLEGSSNPQVTVIMRGGWNIGGTLHHEFYTFEPETYAGYEVVIDGERAPFDPAGEVSNLNAPDITVTTPVFRTFNASVQVRWGGAPIFAEAARGRDRRLTASANLRPTGSIRVAATLTTARLLRDSDGSEYARTIIPRLTLEYQPNRATFVRFVSEYRSQRTSALVDGEGRPLLVNGAPVPSTSTGALRIDALFSYRPTPGTVAFFGYGSSLERPDDLLFPRELRRTADGFFVKLAYQFRR